jgi:D-glycero-D-manno-heptose 1,7-bisphosphate phosphatase
VRRAVFLDRDGTLNEEVEYLHRIEDLRVLPGVADALRRLRGAAFLLVVVTNQAGIGRGYYDPRDAERLHRHLNRTLERNGAGIDSFYFCPYHPEAKLERYRGESPDRKPAPGMLLRASREHDIDLARSFMVGDHEKDVEAGRAAGCRTVLVGTGYGVRFRDRARYDHFAADLPAAADWILSCPDREP